MSDHPLIYDVTIDAYRPVTLLDCKLYESYGSFVGDIKTLMYDSTCSPAFKFKFDAIYDKWCHKINQLRETYSKSTTPISRHSVKFVNLDGSNPYFPLPQEKIVQAVYRDPRTPAAHTMLQLDKSNCCWVTPKFGSPSHLHSWKGPNVACVWPFPTAPGTLELTLEPA